jgi:hypothetical protein
MEHGRHPQGSVSMITVRSTSYSQYNPKESPMYPVISPICEASVDCSVCLYLARQIKVLLRQKRLRSRKARLRKWDISRRYSFVVTNPARIPRAKFSLGYDLVYSNDPPSGTTVSLPSDPLIGNDDTGAGDEDDNPYQKSTTQDASHGIGQIVSYDFPAIYICPSLEHPKAIHWNNTFLRKSSRGCKSELSGIFFLIQRHGSSL